MHTTIKIQCVPEDDDQFANAVRAVATYLRLAQPRLVAGRGAWEAPLRSAFGYPRAEARIHVLTGGPPSATLYREGAPARVAHRRRRDGLGPCG